MPLAALTYAHVVSDFSLVTVVENSHTTKPLVYKIAGVWGNHEGSMLLWVLILAIFGAAVASFAAAWQMNCGPIRSAVQGWIAFAFLLFILLTSDPFARRFPAPFEGHDLNPLAFRTLASRYIRRCSISAMSASRLCSPSRRRR